MRVGSRRCRREDDRELTGTRAGHAAVFRILSVRPNRRVGNDRGSIHETRCRSKSESGKRPRCESNDKQRGPVAFQNTLSESVRIGLETTTDDDTLRTRTNRRPETTENTLRRFPNIGDWKRETKIELRASSSDFLSIVSRISETEETRPSRYESAALLQRNTLHRFPNRRPETTETH